MSTAEPSGPILVCYDGSESSLNALRSVGPLLAARDMVVLTVWESLTLKLATSGSFVVTGVNDENERLVDNQEAEAARAAAQEGAERARERGFSATARSEQATQAVWRTIVDVANEIDAPLIASGTRGRGPIKSALLGSVSHAVLREAHRPVLIAPDPRDGD